jgi:hypothetical protein
MAGLPHTHRNSLRHPHPRNPWDGPLHTPTHTHPATYPQTAQTRQQTAQARQQWARVPQQHQHQGRPRQQQRRHQQRRGALSLRHPLRSPPGGALPTTEGIVMKECTDLSTQASRANQRWGVCTMIHTHIHTARGGATTQTQHGQAAGIITHGACPVTIRRPVLDRAWSRLGLRHPGHTWRITRAHKVTAQHARRRGVTRHQQARRPHTRSSSEGLRTQEPQASSTMAGCRPRPTHPRTHRQRH